MCQTVDDPEVVDLFTRSVVLVRRLEPSVIFVEDRILDVSLQLLVALIDGYRPLGFDHLA